MRIEFQEGVEQLMRTLLRLIGLCAVLASAGCAVAAPGFYDAEPIEEYGRARCYWSNRFTSPIVYQESDFIRAYFEPATSFSAGNVAGRAASELARDWTDAEHGRAAPNGQHSARELLERLAGRPCLELLREPLPVAGTRLGTQPRHEGKALADDVDQVRPDLIQLGDAR